MSLISVLIVEDHNIVRTGIRNILEETFKIKQFVAVDRFEDALKEITTSRFDLMILDINVPGGDTPTMIKKLQDVQPGIKILIFSGYDEKIYAFPYLQAGANGYVAKDGTDEEFTLAVKTVLDGHTYLSNGMQELALQKALHPKKEISNNIFDTLSGREMEVYHLLLKGYSTAEIGALTNLQLSTISTYKRKIFDKTGTSNVVELMNLSKKVGGASL